MSELLAAWHDNSCLRNSAPESSARVFSLPHSIAVALLGSGLIATASAQGPAEGALNVDMAECIELESPEARQACYEERVEAALAERDNAAAAPASAGDPQSTQPPAAAATPQPAPAATAAQESDTGFTPDEIFGTITALRERSPDQYAITLDNGQVWEMTRSRKYPLRVGLDVRLTSTRWGGSYRLTAIEYGSFVQVRRAL